jgi:hypothetical protein
MNANDRVALVIGKMMIKNCELEATIAAHETTIAAQAEELKKLKEMPKGKKPKDNAADRI